MSDTRDDALKEMMKIGFQLPSRERIISVTRIGGNAIIIGERAIYEVRPHAQVGFIVDRIWTLRL